MTFACQDRQRGDFSSIKVRELVRAWQTRLARQQVSLTLDYCLGWLFEGRLPDQLQFSIAESMPRCVAAEAHGDKMQASDAAMLLHRPILRIHALNKSLFLLVTIQGRVLGHDSTVRVISTDTRLEPNIQAIERAPNR